MPTNQTPTNHMPTSQMSLDDQPQDFTQEVPSAEPRVFSVSEINQGIRQTLEGKYALIWLKGEISNFKAHTSGHHYFSLKDKKSQISAVMFRGFNTRLKFKPQDGQEVLVRGRVTVYEPRGNYQIFCELMEPVGLGALQMAYEQLKSKLQKEGLFEQARKRPLPTLPGHVALVTSPTGAAVRDMLNVLGRRFKGLKITIVPVLVQGDKAPASIVSGIQMANRLPDVDVLIVGRGGGSIEDLWGFNDENVARAIAASRLPVISAVGHEVDFTIADFVADLRAPTPSAAAELVVRSAAELNEKIIRLARSLRSSLFLKLETTRKQLKMVGARLVDPQRKLQDYILRLDELQERLQGATQRYFRDRSLRLKLLGNRLGTPLNLIQAKNHRLQMFLFRLSSDVKKHLEKERSKLAQLGAVLNSLSPLTVLDRGFSIVTKNEKIVSSTAELKINDKIHLRFARGTAEGIITQVIEEK